MVQRPGKIAEVADRGSFRDFKRNLLGNQAMMQHHLFGAAVAKLRIVDDFRRDVEKQLLALCQHPGLLNRHLPANMLQRQKQLATRRRCEQIHRHVQRTARRPPRQRLIPQRLAILQTHNRLKNRRDLLLTDDRQQFVVQRPFPDQIGHLPPHQFHCRSVPAFLLRLRLLFRRFGDPLTENFVLNLGLHFALLLFHSAVQL